MNFLYKNLNEERYSKTEAVFYEYNYYFGNESQDKIGKTIYNFYRDDGYASPSLKIIKLNSDIRKIYRTDNDDAQPIAKYVIQGRCPDGYLEKEAGYLLIADNAKLCPEQKLDSILAIAITTSLMVGTVNKQYLAGFIIGGLGMFTSAAICNFFESEESKEKYYEWTRVCLVNDEI